MSNADDRCAREGCGLKRSHPDHYSDKWRGPTHAFVEPAAQAENSTPCARCGGVLGNHQAWCRQAQPNVAQASAETVAAVGHLTRGLPRKQPTPGDEYAFCKFVDGKMVECDGYGNEPGWRERNQPAPSGDEATVREIARAEAESIATRWVPAHMTARQGMVDDIAASLVRYRALGADAGKADGAREERNECELTVRDSCICQVAECACSARLRDIARAIARRGGERKEDRGDGAWKPTCAEHTDVDCESECIGRIRCSRECGVGDATSAERHRWGCAKASALRARRGSAGI